MARRESAASSTASTASVALTEEEVLHIAHLQSTIVLHTEPGDDEECSRPPLPHSASFRDLPSASRTQIFMVIAATVVFAPIVMLSAHISTQGCWKGDPGEDGLEECGEAGKGKFGKPWFLCWASYVGQSMCLLVAWFNNRRARPEEDQLSETESCPDSAPSLTVRPTKRVLLCGCCCGHDVFRDATHAMEEGIRMKSHQETLVGAVPTFSDRNGNPLSYKSLSWPRRMGLAFFPGVMDLAMSALQFVSLLSIPPSLTIMFKSLSIVWVTLISPHVLPGRKILRYQYFAVTVAITGAVTIALSAMLQEAAETREHDTEDDSSGAGQQAVAIGILFAVLAGLCAALSSIAMEKMMVELDVDAATLVGEMGIVGLTLSAAMVGVSHVLPGADNGRMEDFVGTMQLLRSNGLLLLIMVLYGTVASGLNNWALGEATHVLSSVTMLLIRNVCTFLLWGAEIALFYGVAGDTLGSPLFAVPGVVKLVGFFAMSLALALYVGMFRVPIASLYPDRHKHTKVTGDRVSAEVTTEASTTDVGPSSSANYAAHKFSVIHANANSNNLNLNSMSSFGQGSPFTSSRRLARANAVRLTVSASHAEKVKAAMEYAQRRRMAIW